MVSNPFYFWHKWYKIKVFYNKDYKVFIICNTLIDTQYKKYNNFGSNKVKNVDLFHATEINLLSVLNTLL